MYGFLGFLLLSAVVYSVSVIDNKKLFLGALPDGSMIQAQTGSIFPRSSHDIDEAIYRLLPTAVSQDRRSNGLGRPRTRR